MCMSRRNGNAHFAYLKHSEAMLCNKENSLIICFSLGEHRPHLALRHRVVGSVFDPGYLSAIIERPDSSKK